MRAARFCSECGERLTRIPPTSLLFRSLCPQCAPRFRQPRLALFALFLLMAGLGFSVGHYSAAPKPFYVIGTPIETGKSQAPSLDTKTDHSPGRGKAFAAPEQLVISPIAPDNICGALTKSGRPCQRKVKGGGFCWQHRERSGEKSHSPQSQ